LHFAFLIAAVADYWLPRQIECGKEMSVGNEFFGNSKTGVLQNLDIDGEKRIGTGRSSQIVEAVNAKKRRPEVERVREACRS